MVMGHKCEQQMAQIVQQPMCHLKLQNDPQTLPELDQLHSKATETDKCEIAELY